MIAVAFALLIGSASALQLRNEHYYFPTNFDHGHYDVPNQIIESVNAAMAQRSRHHHQNSNDGFDEIMELASAAMVHDHSYDQPLKPDVKNKWAQIFKSYAGRSILLAGDSLMRHVHGSIVRAFEECGGHRNESRQETLTWQDNTVQGKFSEAVYRIDDTTFRLGYLDHYDFVDASTNILNDKVGENSVPIPKLTQLASRFDRTISNLGHCIFGHGCNATAKTNMVLTAALKAGVHHLALMEHPAQHFLTKTGDYSEGTYKKKLECVCAPRAEMANQQVYIQNHAMADAARNFGIPIIKLWEHTVPQCHSHIAPDCTHYIRQTIMEDWVAYLKFS